jgi:hypothetical protein
MGQFIPQLIAGAIVASGAGIIGYLFRRRQERKKLIRQVLSLCNRLAIYTKMHNQTDPAAMFAALEECRRSLQPMVDYVEPENRKQLVRAIIEELLYIRGRKKAFDEADEAADYPALQEIKEEIDTAKRNIIGNLVEVSKLANVAYDLPRDLTQSESYLTVEEANRPYVSH